MFENVDNGQTMAAWVYYKLTYEPKGSGEIIIKALKALQAWAS